jgi:hypothetical protein
MRAEVEAALKALCDGYFDSMTRQDVFPEDAERKTLEYDATIRAELTRLYAIEAAAKVARLQFWRLFGVYWALTAGISAHAYDAMPDGVRRACERLRDPNPDRERRIFTDPLVKAAGWALDAALDRKDTP